MKRFSAIVIVIFLASCRESYDPPVTASTSSFLVVEANLNPAGPTAVLLSRTVGLETRTGTKAENNAQVTVEGRDNSVRTLAAAGIGTYSSSNLGLTLNNEYRLRIKTSDGKQYVSAFVKAKKTPAIDSINWVKDNEGLHIYANAKDVSGSTRYYRWNYDETWEIRSLYYSDIIYEAGRIRNRVFPQEDVHVCWKYNNSSSIIVANSERLVSDIIYRAPLIDIPPLSEKLAVRYSVLVRQYAMDRDGYNFYELMKRNTEQVGSLFSPQPTEVRGNITAVDNPNEFVLGYVSVSTVEQQRIFIETPWAYFRECPDQRVPDNADSLAFYFGTGAYIPYTYNNPPGDYFGSYPQCVDCTKRGGTITRPSYW